MSQNAVTRADVYSRVTDRIVADLVAGTPTWHKPWKDSLTGGRVALPLRFTGDPYRGVNVLLLWAEAIEHGYGCPTWMTYRQAEAIGAQVRKGERGTMVVYADRLSKTERDESGQESERQISILKSYSVFNVEQIDNLPESYSALVPVKPEPPQLIEQAETFFNQTGATIRHGGAQAFYSPAADYIQLPSPEAFVDAQAYAAVTAHELTHWTGRGTRLSREFGLRFGDDAYAVEELVAEVGAAFMCADLSITLTPRADHAAYLDTWLKVLKQDKRAIFTAAAQAQRAVDYLHQLQVREVIA